MKNIKAQSTLEYIILIGIVSVTLYYMGTAIKRGAQGMVKVTADQIGSQKDAEQSFDSKTGFLVESISNMQSSSSKNKQQIALNISNTQKEFISQSTIRENSDSVTKTITNGGFIPE
jgi:hypothetical protein